MKDGQVKEKLCFNVILKSQNEQLKDKQQTCATFLHVAKVSQKEALPPKTEKNVTNHQFSSPTNYFTDSYLHGCKSQPRHRRPATPLSRLSGESSYRLFQNIGLLSINFQERHAI
jgi:hypothetical protein